jgi:hypothetical protein
MGAWETYANLVRKYLNPQKTARAVGGAIRHGAEQSRELRGKESVTVGGNQYRLVPVKTKVITKDDDLDEVVRAFVQPSLRNGDIIAISESLVAIAQGRAFAMRDIRPGFFAKLLYPWVTNVTYGTGLGCPGSMQKAIEDVGLWRILSATFCGLMGRLTGLRGAFYQVAGERVKSIDVRWNHPIPLDGASDYVILSPLNGKEVCASLRAQTGCAAAIVDVNDVSSRVLAHDGLPISEEDLAQALRGNPAGQDGQQTPFILLRPIG